MNKLPTVLVRGDIYYLMDGTYGSYTVSTANSGTSRITVKKAQSYDYGRTSDGCPNDISAGWNEGAMASGQAHFTAFQGRAGIGYMTLDGNGTSTAPGCGISPSTKAATKDCGIKFTTPIGGDGPFDLGAWSGGSNRSNGWTIRYTEIEGGGDLNNSGNYEENWIWCRDGCNDLLVEHAYWYESGVNGIKLPNSTGAIFRDSHFRQNKSTAAAHGQLYMSEDTSSNVQFYNNIIQDIEGTAVWTFNTGSQASNYNIYNNVILRTSGSTRPGTSNGILACINDGSKCTNMRFIGNTIINMRADYDGSGGILNQWNNGSSYTWQNNLVYLSTTKSGASSIGFNLNGATFTHTNNAYLNSGTVGGGTASGNITVASGAPNPFVDWQNYEFRLASQNPYWGSGATLASPFNVDMASNPRAGTDGVWNRGAFEYGTAQESQGPLPPTALTTVAR